MTVIAVSRANTIRDRSVSGALPRVAGCAVRCPSGSAEQDGNVFVLFLHRYYLNRRADAGAFLAALFFAVFPLSVVGVGVLGFPVSLPLVVNISLSAVLLVSAEIALLPAGLAIAFLSWSCIAAAPTYALSEYAPSVALLLTLWVPLLCARYAGWQHRNIVGGLLLGLALSILLASYDVLAWRLGSGPLATVLGSTIPQADPREWVFLKLRLQGAMTEPASYAVFLVFVYAALDHWAWTICRARLLLATLRILTALALLATVSLSGWILFLVYLAVRQVERSDANWKRRRRSRLIAGVSAAVVIVGVAILLRSGAMESVGEQVGARIATAVAAVGTGDVAGSEGTRINALRVMWNYWHEEGTARAIWGEGFGNIDSWLKGRFGGQQRTQLAEGRIHNVFAYIGIASGAVGLSLYIAFVVTVLRAWPSPLPRSYLWLWIVAHFATAQIIDYQLWGYLLLGLICSRLITSNQRVTPQTCDLRAGVRT